MATAPLCAEPHGKRSAQARSWKPGRRRQRCERLAGKASPARDERLANLEQRDPRSGDAKELFVYYLFCKQMLLKQEHGG